MTILQKFKNNILPDLSSGFILSLIALPLCIGIAGASLGNSMNSPAIAGIVTAIIGGLVVSRLAGSYVTIHGPAAGMIVVVQHGIQSLGSIGGNFNAAAGYERFLAAMVVAGILQLLLGVFRLARYAAMFPVNIIHGMLAAIGIIIISKQVHVALGVTPQATKPLALYSEIPQSLANLNPKIAAIGIISIGILLFFKLTQKKILQKIPAPIVVVLIAITLGIWFDLRHEHSYHFFNREYQVGAKYLVSLPDNIWTALPKPDFSVIYSSESIGVIFSIFFVASLESLLSANAVDKLDPEHRKSDLNKEIIANGIGNSLLGLIGGLPLIAEIVRSSANISYGARSSWSNFFHGFFLLIFLVLIPQVIHLIPNAALAAILIVVGYNLAKPQEFKHALYAGKEQFIFFATTLIITVADDLLVGVAAGLVLKIFFLLANGVRPKHLFTLAVQTKVQGKTLNLIPQGPVIFANFFRLTEQLSLAKQKHQNIVIDFSHSQYVDHTSMTAIADLISEYSREGINLKLQGIQDMQPLSQHPHAARRRKNQKGK